MVWKPADDQDYILDISSNDEGSVEVGDRRWTREISKYLCKECTWPLRERYPNPVDVVLCKKIHGVGAFRVNLMGPLVIHKGLYECLSRFPGTAAVGRCLMRSGRMLHDTDYVTLYDIAEHMITVQYTMPKKRTLMPVFYEPTRCTLCGVDVIPYWHSSNVWVSRKHVSGRHWFMEGMRIFVDRWLNERMPWEKFPDARKYRVYIRDDV